jgi:hypothetical protein
MRGDHMAMKPTGSGEIYVEFIAQGAVVKATAIDSKTGIEASIVGPVGASQTALQAAAVRKLEYVMKKKSG